MIPTILHNPGKGCDCAVCARPLPEFPPMDAITATMKHDVYESERRLRRAEYLAWLAERQLPGTPATPFVQDPLATEPTRRDPILGDA